MSKKPKQQIQGLIVDMDGVLWRDQQPIGDLPEIFAQIKLRNWQITLATNNSTQTKEMYLEKLRGLGVTLEPFQIVNSSQATAYYLSTVFPNGGDVFVIGEQGLINDLREKGFESIRSEPDDNRVLAVVVGMDREFTYHKLRQATMLIRNGVPFLATNPDRTFPTPQGLVPGTGAIVAALEASTDVTSKIIGKPSPEMYQVALVQMGTVAESTLVVGDRLETDIAGGQALGCPTALVLSGVTSIRAAREWSPAPNWIEPDLASLLKRL